MATQDRKRSGRQSGANHLKLVVRGDSMAASATFAAPDGRSFLEGSILTIEIGTALRDGDYAVVQLDPADRSPTFGRYRDDGSGRWLDFLNPNCAPAQITSDSRIIGAVAEANIVTWRRPT